MQFIPGLFSEGLVLTSKHDFTLQMNTFIASDKIVSPNFKYGITLQMNMFITSDAHILCRRQTLLEMNVFCAGEEHFSDGDNKLKMCVEISATHIQLETRNSQMQIIMLSSSPKTGAIMLQRSKGYLHAQ